ncbi:hypothetical protein [Sphingomonas soli]|uniref:hypothetical protein n=1 Tax=Sphingomonas soli TaxID=266127 RepID=UPI001C3F422D|nr:hypothetical protein [Sphingomonas soli]
MPRVLSGGTALSGEEDVISTDGGGRWEISYGEMDLDNIDLQRAWDAWTAHLAGGAQSVLVPILSLKTAPRPFAGSGLASPSDIYADDDVFPTEVRFASPHIVAVVGADAALRATTVEIVISQGAMIQHGVKFSIGKRGYKVGRVTARDGLSATCKISPPLREAIETGDAVNFDWPVVECRAGIGQDLASAITMGMFGTTSISFVEHITYG